MFLLLFVDVGGGALCPEGVREASVVLLEAAAFIAVVQGRERMVF